MALVTIPNTFTNGTPANATAVNANFTAITDQVNGNLDNSNIDAAAAIVESKILFSASGHNHSGGTNGINIPEASVDFAAAGGHTHNGTDATEIAAATATVRGGVEYKKYSGDVTIADGGSTQVTFAAAFSDIPVVSVWMVNDLSVQPTMLLLTRVTTSSFYVHFRDGDGTSRTARWAAIGI